MDPIKEILKTIDDAIAKFQDAIPGIQKLIYEGLQPLIKNFKIKDGRLLNDVENLRIIGDLKNKLQKIIMSADYSKSVNGFTESFAAVSLLNNAYFADFNKKFKPKRTLPIIRQLAVEQTLNDLIGQGMNSSVIDPIKQILNQNITTGGSYAKFQEQLRNHILSNETGDGSLVRYTKQITTDAIHQYNAQYHDAIAQDLNFNWGRYIGSNLTTSREFCVLLTDKQWVHRTELPQIIKGKIGNENCKLSKTTGLPLGMMADTNADNFKIRRGGYQCGHQFFWVPDNAVPDSEKRKFQNLGKETETNFHDSHKEKIKIVADSGWENDLKKMGITHDQLINITGGIPSKNTNDIVHTIHVKNNAIRSQIRTSEYNIVRDIYPLEKRIHNTLMVIDKPGEGLGLNLFINQVTAARQAGFKMFDVSAARSGTYNGYYTWARFGYSLGGSKDAFMQLMKSNSRNETNLIELMSTKEGVQFWKSKGFWFEGAFDLADGSENITAFLKYLESRKVIVSL